MVGRLTSHKYCDDGVKGWIRKVAHRYKRRVPPWVSYDDLVQEGHMVAWRCVLKFRDGGLSSAPNARQRSYMGCFMRALENRMRDIVRMKHPEELTESALSVDDNSQLEAWQDGAAVYGEATLAASLARLPELSELLLGLAKGQDGPIKSTRIVKKVLPSGQPRFMLLGRPVRETTDQHYTRCFGKHGLPELIASFLTGP